MALILKDKVQETSTSYTTGSFTLAGAITGFQSFSAIGNGNTTYYSAFDSSGNWEVGLGTYSSSTLSRTTILSSSNSGSVVTFSGTVNVFCTYPSSKALYIDGDTFNAPNSVISVNNSTDALRITQVGSGGALLIEDSANPDSTPFMIDASGKIKNGYLTDWSGITAPRLGIDSTSAGAFGTTIYGYNSAAPIISSIVGGGTTFGSNTAVASGQSLGRYRFYGTDGTAPIHGASIEALVDATPSTNSMPTRLIFKTTASGSSSPDERMRIDSAGQVGIGATPSAGRNLTVSKNITGAVGSYAQINAGAVQSDVTTAAFYFASYANTQSTNFALGQITHYTTGGVSTFQNVTAGGSVGSQYGFAIDSSLTGATNNYGFYGNIAAGTGRYNLIMQGTADNYMAGALGIGTFSLTGYSLRVNKNLTGATTSIAIDVSPTIQSDVTASGTGFRTQLSTVAAAFNLTSMTHYSANQITIGVGNAVTNQYGLLANASLTGATNNYGFYGNIAAPTSGITTTGTISSISSSGTTVTVNHNAITYTNGQTVTITATANATALVSGVTCTILTVGSTDFTAIGAASNTVGVSFTATGAGTGTGTVTLNVQGSGKTVAGAASGSFTFTTTTSQTFAAVTVLTGSVTVSTRYNLYMNGTAANYFGGDMQFNKTVTATGTTGARTIDKNAGTVNFAAAATSLVVTNNLVTTSSIIICTVGTNDTTMKSVQAVAAAGSFTLYPSAAPTAETRVNFIVIN
jgi:hypothetical protein